MPNKASLTIEDWYILLEVFDQARLYFLAHESDESARSDRSKEDDLLLQRLRPLFPREPIIGNAQTCPKCRQFRDGHSSGPAHFICYPCLQSELDHDAAGIISRLGDLS